MHLMLMAVSLLSVADPEGGGFRVVTVDAADAPQRLDAADLDGDGDIDLCVLAEGAGFTTTNLQMLLNEGGQFTPGWSVVESASPYVPSWDIDLADSDNDGDTDVIYVVPYHSPRQRFNDGAGHFDAVRHPPTFSLRFQHEAADMDGDGDVDLVHYDEDIFFCGEFGTLLGFGNGTFAYDDASLLLLNIGIDSFARRFTLGDVTGDGLRDAVMASSSSGLRLVRGLPPAASSTLPGWFGPQSFYQVGCNDVALVDLDGNGWLDAVATVPSLASVVVFSRQSGNSFGSPHLFKAGASPGAIVAADFDRDGFADVIVTDPATGSVNLLRGAGNGRLKAPETFIVGADPTDVVAADLDGDSDLDLAVTCAIDGNVALLFNQSL